MSAMPARDVLRQRAADGGVDAGVGRIEGDGEACFATASNTAFQVQPASAIT